MKSILPSAIRRAIAAMVALGLLVAVLSGCHTVRGVGEDITAVGQAGQDFLDGR